MSTAPDSFIRHADEMLAVARRLSSIGVAVYGHDYNYSHFGSWSVVAGIERERFQFCWEGREFTFIIAQGVLVEGRREWQPIRTLNLRHQEALSGMEKFLHDKFGA